MATNQDSVDAECPHCGNCFEADHAVILDVHEAAEGLLRYYTAGTSLTAGEVDGLAEDITRLLIEKYHVSLGVI